MLPNSASIPKYSSVKTLLNGLFDYAGLFPPASLSLEAAVHEYLNHRGQLDSWMLGPFVLPVAKLEQFISLLAERDLDSPVALDILPSGSQNNDSFLEALSTDLSQCALLQSRHDSLISIEAFEFRFPMGTFSDPNAAFRLITDISPMFSKNGFEKQPVFGELVKDESFRESLPIYFMALAQSSGRILGKIRCGGMIEADFPTPLELAEYIFTATKLSQPFKATAGLHHPLRHFNTDQHLKMHGFINVLFASTLARVHGLSSTEIERILEDENPNSFVFSSSGIQWQQLSASNTQFIEQRRLLTLSIGSCSFDEPRTDLMDLGWLSHEE